MIHNSLVANFVVSKASILSPNFLDIFNKRNLIYVPPISATNTLYLFNAEILI